MHRQVLLKLWRDDVVDAKGNVTLSLPADALPVEALAAFGKKVRLGSAALGNSLFVRRVVA
jgi:hypothetical protein